MRNAASTQSLPLRPPSRQDAAASCSQLGIPSYRSLDPFYSREVDRQADRQKDLKQTVVVADLLPFGDRNSLEELQSAALRRAFGLVPQVGRSLAPDSQADPRRRLLLQTVRRPPSRRQIADWFRVRAVLKKHDEQGTKLPEAPQAHFVANSGCLGDDPKPEEDTEGRRKRKGKRKIYVVKHDEDSDGSEMSCSSLSSCEEDPVVQSSAARTRPLDFCSPIFTKDRTVLLTQPPPRSILRQSSRDSGKSRGDSPPLTRTVSCAESAEAAAEEVPPGRLKRRRISWDLPGRHSEGTEEDDQQVNESIGSSNELSESIMNRVKVNCNELFLYCTVCIVKSFIFANCVTEQVF